MLLTIYVIYSSIVFFFCRTKAVGPVQDIVTATVNERELLFVLHLDGSLRIWDIFNHTKLLSYNVRSNDIEGNSWWLYALQERSYTELLFAYLC